MAGLLQDYGYTLVGEASREEADVWLINSCTVKNPSQDHMATDIARGRAMDKPVIVAGCVSQAEPSLNTLQGLSLIGVQQIERVVDVVREALAGNTVRLLERRVRPSLDLPKVRRNPLVEIIPINTGCLGSCTYCKTVYARGRLGSYEPSALLSRLDSAVAEGVAEVWLTSEDAGAYGRDLGSSLPSLLEAMLERVPEGRMLRVGMTNPPYILQQLPAIAKLLSHPRCYAFLHVPVQSGSNRVLHTMRREYTREEFCRVADTLLASVPSLLLATDIICGMPGETEEDHQQTLALVRKYRFPVLNISQFYPRPGTLAAKMKRVPTHVVKERTRELSALFNSYTTFDTLLNTTLEVLVTDSTAVSRPGATPQLIAHDKGYVQVLLPYVPEHMGCWLQVRVTHTSKFHVLATVLRVLRPPPSSASADKATVDAAGVDPTLSPDRPKTGRKAADAVKQQVNAQNGIASPDASSERVATTEHAAPALPPPADGCVQADIESSRETCARAADERRMQATPIFSANSGLALAEAKGPTTGAVRLDAHSPHGEVRRLGRRLNESVFGALVHAWAVCSRWLSGAAADLRSGRPRAVLTVSLLFAIGLTGLRTSRSSLVFSKG